MCYKHFFQFLALLSCSAALLSNQAVGAIITIPDALNQTGNYSVSNSVPTISGESSVYLAGTITFEGPGGNGIFNVVELPPGPTWQWGQTFDADDFEYIIPGPLVLVDGDITAGESFLGVLKINQLTGDYSFYFNPNLSLEESQNTPAFTRLGGPTAAISEVSFRGGNAANVTNTHYTGFALYTGNSTPFAVPEPTSLALCALFGLLGAIYLGLRGRRNASA